MCEGYVTTRRRRLKKCLRRKIIRGRAFGLAELESSANNPVAKQLLALQCYWTGLRHEITKNTSIFYFSEKVRISGIERLNQEKVSILSRFHVDDFTKGAICEKRWEDAAPVAPATSTRKFKDITLDLFESNCRGCA